LTQFYIDYNSTVTVQSTFGQFVPFSINTPDVTTNSEQEFEVNNTRKDHIESIFLKDLVLTITNPSNEDFSFLNKIEVYISSPLHTEQKVASKLDISNSVGAQLVCDVENVDLQNYIKDDNFTLRLKTTTDETIAQNIEIDVYSRFFVDAKVFK
jgi:hypothetical protein